MSCRLWVMLILIIFQLKSKVMTLHYMGDCFYEKRTNTALHGYNELTDRWISDFDCFDRCLRTDHHKCRSFEHWHGDQHDLCVRANISLTDQPSITGHGSFVDYYEINCRKDMKVVRPSTIHCPNDQLFLTVTLNGIHSNHILLGDDGCKSSWSNATHAQFTTHVDNCSLMLTNGSLIGKIRWENGSKDGNSSKQYERFFACPSNIYHIRSMQQTTTPSTLSISRHTLSMLPHHGQISREEQKITSPYRINLKWSLHNHSYSCPETCFISLYSFINITLLDLSLITSKYSIDSCELQALSPYTNYLQSKRLISQGCSIDPTVIHAPIDSSQLSIFYFSFYLFHILKEPIPFQIQCKILHNVEKTKLEAAYPNCSSLLLNENNRSSMNKRDYFYTLFRSSSVYVARQLPSLEYEQQIFHHQNTIRSIATVHYSECSLFALCVLILYTV